MAIKPVTNRTHQEPGAAAAVPASSAALTAKPTARMREVAQAARPAQANPTDIASALRPVAPARPGPSAAAGRVHKILVETAEAGGGAQKRALKGVLAAEPLVRLEDVSELQTIFSGLATLFDATYRDRDRIVASLRAFFGCCGTSTAADGADVLTQADRSKIAAVRLSLLQSAAQAALREVDAAAASNWQTGRSRAAAIALLETFGGLVEQALEGPLSPVMAPATPNGADAATPASLVPSAASRRKADAFRKLLRTLVQRVELLAGPPAAEPPKPAA